MCRVVFSKVLSKELSAEIKLSVVSKHFQADYTYRKNMSFFMLKNWNVYPKKFHVDRKI